MCKRNLVGRLFVLLLAFAVLITAGNLTVFAAEKFEFSTDFVRLQDVPAAFDKLSPIGMALAKPNSKNFPEEIIVVNSNHIQGVARYGDYTIISVNGHDSLTDHGYLFVYDEKELVHRIDLPASFGTHAGGLAAAGRYLAVPNNGILLFDMRPLDEGNVPVQIDELGGGGGSIGMTEITYQGKSSLLFSDYSMGKMYVYPLEGAAGWIPLTSIKEYNEGEFLGGAQEDIGRKGWGMNNVALLTDKNNDVWVLELASKQDLSGPIADLIGEKGINYRDAIILYKAVVNDNGTVTITGPVREMEVQTFDNYLLALGSHFRFSGTVQVVDENSFAVFSTPSLPGNLALGAADKALKTSGFVKNTADFLNPPTLSINAWLPQENHKSVGNIFYELIHRLFSIPIFSGNRK